jgi:hypothetical protein
MQSFPYEFKQFVVTCGNWCEKVLTSVLLQRIIVTCHRMYTDSKSVIEVS